MYPKINKCMIYFIINVDKHYNTNRSLWSTDSRAIIGRIMADIWRLSADGSSLKSHLPTVWLSSADWRPMTGRPSADIMMTKSSKSRPIIGRPSPDVSAMAKPLKIGGSVNETFNFFRQKSHRPTKKSAKIGADVGHNRPTSPDFPIFGSPTVGRPSVWVMWL